MKGAKPMSPTSDSWIKWFAELGRVQGTFTGEVVKSWYSWAQARTETLQNTDLDPRVKYLLSQISALTNGMNSEQTNDAQSKEAFALMAKRLEKLEATVALLKESASHTHRGDPNAPRTDPQPPHGL